jgi:hypothetical protein
MIAPQGRSRGLVMLSLFAAAAVAAAGGNSGASHLVGQPWGDGWSDLVAEALRTGSRRDARSREHDRTMVVARQAPAPAHR